MTDRGLIDRLRAELDVAAAAAASCVAGARPIAIGWATVELDRAVLELAVSIGIPTDRFLAAPASIALGARCRVAPDALPTGESVVVLEPASEGRLAATLARLAEGPSVAWLAVADLAAAAVALRSTGVTVSAARAGPLGPERLVLDGPAHGPHRLLVQLAAGTIRA